MDRVDPFRRDSTAGKVLVPSNGIDTKSEPVGKIIAAVSEEVRSKGDAAAQKLVGEHAVAPEDVVILEGAFPGGSTHLVVLSKTVGNEEEGAECLTGAWTLGPAGELIAVLPLANGQTLALLGVVDYDGAGPDGAFFDARSTTEPAETQTFVWWEGGKLQTRVTDGFWA